MIAAVAALATLASGPQFGPIDASLHGAYVFANVLTLDNKAHHFLVDSGSTTTFVSKAILTPAEQKRKNYPLRWNIGQSSLSVNADLMEAKDLPIVDGTAVEGIIGVDALTAIQLEIDYSARTVQARFGAALAAVPGTERVALRPDSEGLWTVDGSIGDQRLTLCVDTGATTLVLDKSKMQLAGMHMLPASKIHTFDGLVETDRRLVESMRVGPIDLYWMVACTQPWSDADDGVVGTCVFSSKVVLDLRGRALYYSPLTADDRIGRALERILGLPVRPDGGGISFRDSVPPLFGHWAGAKLLRAHGIAPGQLLAAVRREQPKALETILDAFRVMREDGLITTTLPNGTTELAPMKIED
jgi:predicted aspartyl protease